MPINLFSTKSTLPIPFFPANKLSFSKRLDGDNFLPLIPIGSLF